MGLGEYLSTFALLISLASVAISVRFATRGSKTNAYDRATDLFLVVDHLFIEHPEVRPYFYNGKVLQPRDPVASKVEAMAELILDVFEWIWRRQQELDQRDQEGWRTYILDFLGSSSALLDYHNLHASWHPAVKILLSKDAEIDSVELGD